MMEWVRVDYILYIKGSGLFKSGFAKTGTVWAMSMAVSAKMLRRAAVFRVLHRQQCGVKLGPTEHFATRRHVSMKYRLQHLLLYRIIS